MVSIDVLHAVDLGVAQDLAGNVFNEYIRHFAPGRSIKDKVSALWVKLSAHYKAMRTPCRLDNLIIEMVKRDGKAPKHCGQRVRRPGAQYLSVCSWRWR